MSRWWSSTVTSAKNEKKSCFVRRQLVQAPIQRGAGNHPVASQHRNATNGDEGFQQLVTEVSLGRAGIVMGLEVSRLARNSTDWHRLLAPAAHTHVLHHAPVAVLLAVFESFLAAHEHAPIVRLNERQINRVGRHYRQLWGRFRAPDSSNSITWVAEKNENRQNSRRVGEVGFSEVRAARDVPEPARVSMQVHDELVQVMVAIAMNAMPTSPAAAVAGP